MSTDQKTVSVLNLALAAAAAAFLACPAPARAFCVSGGEFTVESSVVDNGGGAKLNGGEYSSRGSIAQTALPADSLVTGGNYVNREGFYNPPHFTFQKGLLSALSTPSQDISVTLPANSVDLGRFDITMNRDPMASSSVDPGKITEATDKIVHNLGEYSQLLPDYLSEMTIFDEQAVYSKPLLERGVLTLRYRDDDNDGIVDGSNPPVRAETLNTWTLNQDSNMWVRLPDAGANTGAKTLSVFFGVPGVYAVLGALDDSVRNVYAFPVPFRPNGPNAGTGQGQTGQDGACAKCGITFTSVPQSGSIEIYTLDGRLVRKLQIPSNLLIMDVKWDVRTASGDKAASGVYIWRVVSGSNSKTGKLMVIW